jgi:hypothetical protein
MCAMSNALRQHLIEAITGLPGWQDADRRRALFSDLVWGLAAQDGVAPAGSPGEAAESLADLGLAAVAGGSVGRYGGMAGGLWGLIDDLRELGAGANLDALTAEAGRPITGSWSEDPYPGLLPLEHWQAPIYFGRRAETRALLRRLVDPLAPRLQVISGVPGCGKSSLLRAGVRGRLAAGGLPRIPLSERWVVSTLFPAGYGGDPFLALTHGLVRALDVPLGAPPGAPALEAPGEAASLKVGGAEALAGLLDRVLQGRPAGSCWVVVIDQLEELFTVVEPDLAEEFLETLTASLGQPRLRVLASMRADLLDRCFTQPGLIQYLNEGALYVLGPPSRASLERMILGPLTALDPTAAVAVDPHLVGCLLDDAQGHPDGLALMADALKELYTRGKTSGRLDLESYRDLRREGLRGGLARRAELALERAGDGARVALGGLFAHLVHVGDDGRASRRRADRNRLASHPETHRLIQSFAEEDARLVRVREGERPTVELTHETLLNEWPILRQWIKRHREALRLRSQIEKDARAWVGSGRQRQRRWPHEILEPAHTLLIERGLLYDLERDPDVADFLIPESEWLPAELLCSRVRPMEREEIGLRLARIGDQRPGVGLVDGTPAVQWCAIPPGEVRVEGHGIVQVASVRIAAFPVTQVQFEAFLDAEDGFVQPGWWEGLRRGVTNGGRAPGHGNYPATQVSWFDAVAFCRWLSRRLGLPVRLPDEWEWQWAAQSARPGYVYPWGRDWREGHANTEEIALGRVTAVGLHPAGRSLQGAYDLAGNTWEWCRNRYDQPQVVAANIGSPRVLKGGSWRVNRGFARADFRLDGLPEDRMAGSGFRLVTDD